MFVLNPSTRLSFRTSFLLRQGTIAALLLGAVSGCGGGNSEQNQAPPPPPPVKIITQEEESPAAPTSSPAPRKPKAPAQASATTQKMVAPEDAADQFLMAQVPNFTLLDEIQTEAYFKSQADNVYPPLPDTSSQIVKLRLPASAQTASPAPTGRPAKLPAEFQPLNEYGYHESGWPWRIRCEIDQSEMAYIPTGAFILGKEGQNEEVSPQHTAFLSGYYMDLHEVTLEAFEKFRKHLSSQGERPPQAPVNENADGQQPVLGVLWRDANNYAEYVKKSLPTEAQWEKAARGTEGFDHPWGFGRPAWHQARTLNQITPVMTYAADVSPYGIFDLAGNAREWCSDWYTADSYALAIKEGGQIPKNWEGPRSAKPQFHRVIKGNGPNWTLWHRDSRSMSERDPKIGFRCVLKIPEK